jgi:hypothetical protein
LHDNKAKANDVVTQSPNRLVTQLRRTVRMNVTGLGSVTQRPEKKAEKKGNDK